MSKQAIKHLIETRLPDDGLVNAGVEGIKLFQVTTAVPCAPAVYEPCVVAIVEGTKEAILDGESYKYDSSRYLCCPMTMPVEAGTPDASPDKPLRGVMVSLNTRVMTELAIEMESAAGTIHKSGGGSYPRGLALSQWDDAFSEALLRLLQLSECPLIKRCSSRAG